jgi:Mrp family chromosome partitioning ATPase
MSGMLSDEAPVEASRYIGALRRDWKWIVFVAAAAAITAVAISFAAPKTYTATASLIDQDSIGPLAGSADINTVARSLSTINRLTTTDSVLGRARTSVGGNETIESLRDVVSSDVSIDANVITVTATAETANRAARIANAIAASLVVEEQQVILDRYRELRAALVAELARLRAAGASADQIAALEERLAALSVAGTNGGGSLRLIEPASPPSSPTSPRPKVNGFLAFFGAAFLAMLVVLAREQFTPRVSSARELAGIVDLPILGGVPRLGRGSRRRPAQLLALMSDSFQALQASISKDVEGDGPYVIAVTSVVHGEGKSTVSAGLGRALAHVGKRSLIVSGDTRLPTLQEYFPISAGPGLTDVLQAFQSRSGKPADAARMRSLLSASIRKNAAGKDGELSILPAGSHVDDPAELLFGNTLAQAFAVLRRSDYRFILVDCPPLLGVPDTQALIEVCDAVLVVARPERLRIDEVLEFRDKMARLDVRQLGLAIVGIEERPSPYYAAAPRAYA